MAKFFSPIGVALLLAAAGCNGNGPTTLKSGMSLDSAVHLLQREGLEAEDVTGAQLGRTFQVSSSTSEDSLCFDVETHWVTSVFWYRNWRDDRHRAKADRKCEYVRVKAITPDEIRAGLSGKSG
ncbi:MAG: hypothetical protein WBD40_23725 [Tepidisphaeraceae bacterium]